MDLKCFMRLSVQIFKAIYFMFFLQVPSAVWSPFYLSLVENLVNRNGILNFFHDHLRQAVEKKYLDSAEAKKKGYLKLADYFGSKETSSRTVRIENS